MQCKECGSTKFEERASHMRWVTSIVDVAARTREVKEMEEEYISSDGWDGLDCADCGTPVEEDVEDEDGNMLYTWQESSAIWEEVDNIK